MPQLLLATTPPDADTAGLMDGLEQLARTMLEHGLVDELRVLVPHGDGVVILTYSAQTRWC